MKICMIGLGSIGKRHLNNLVSILVERKIDFQIDALRHTSTELEEEVRRYIRKEYSSFGEMDSDYDIIFITNPTSKHAETLRNVIGKTTALFIEKPIFEHAEYEQIMTNAEGIKCHVASPLRYHSVLKELKKQLAGRQVYNVRAIASSYLPDWRKGSDYRNIYSAKKEQGGGVCLDLIHEWDYIIDLFGYPRSVYFMKGHYSSLEINSDDIGLYIGEYEDKTVEIHLDYYGRVPMRKSEIFCEDSVIVADLLESTLTIASGQKKEQIPIVPSDMYRSEMNHFIDGVLGREEMVNGMRHAYQTLKIALGER